MSQKIIATETDFEPRKQPPPKPTEYPSVIATAEVSDITLLSEDGASVYWKPDSPNIGKQTRSLQSSSMSSKKPHSSIATGLLQISNKGNLENSSGRKDFNVSPIINQSQPLQRLPTSEIRTNIPKHITDMIKSKASISRASSFPEEEEKKYSTPVSDPYNPLMYSSGKNPRNVPLRDSSNFTPNCKNSGVKQVIPRAVNFDCASPINVRAYSRDEKENSPGEYGTRSEMISYKPDSANSIDSPDLIRHMMDSKERELSRLRESVIESKNQLISQLQNDLAKKEQQLEKFVSELILSKSNSSPNRGDNRLVANSTRNEAIQTESTHKPAMRSIGVNTACSWNELVNSIKPNNECDCQINKAKASVIKSTCQTSNVIMQSVCIETKDNQQFVTEQQDNSTQEDNNEDFPSHVPEDELRQRSSNGQHREVNMTMRKVVLSTIHEAESTKNRRVYEDQRNQRQDSNDVNIRDLPTSYRNFVHNVGEILQKNNTHQTDEYQPQQLGRQAVHYSESPPQNAQVPSEICHQLQMFDLTSFIDPHSLRRNQYRTPDEHPTYRSHNRFPLNHPTHNQILPAMTYRHTNAYQATNQPPVRLRQPNHHPQVREIQPNIRDDKGATQSTDFSIATEEFLRANGLLQS